MAARRLHPLAERRRATGHTQESFAELLGLDRTTIVRWETGKTVPQPGHRPRLARALNLTTDQLHLLIADAARPAAAVTFDGAELVEAPAAILDRMNYESAELTDQVLDDLEADLNERPAATKKLDRPCWPLRSCANASGRTGYS